VVDTLLGGDETSSTTDTTDTTLLPPLGL